MTDEAQVADLQSANARVRAGQVMTGGLQALAANMLAPPDGEVTDIAGLLKTLKDWAEANKDLVGKAKLILGFGYDQSQLKELRAPTKEELDTISKELPVVVYQSGHFGALDSKALEIARGAPTFLRYGTACLRQHRAQTADF